MSSKLKRTRLVATLTVAFWLVAVVAGGASVAVASGGGDEIEIPGPPHVNWADHSWRGKNSHGGKMGTGLDANGKPILNSKGQPIEPGTEHEMSAPFMWVIINFTVAFMLLAWKAGPPLRRYLEGRHLSVREALEEAASLRDQAKEKLEEYTARIADVEQEVEDLIKEIREDAAAEKERILADAEAQAAKLKKDAEDRIASEIVRARLELEREVVLAAVNAAETILRDKATASDKQTLVNDFITSIEQSQQERA